MPASAAARRPCLLGRILLRVVAGRIDPADVVGLQLGVAEAADQRPAPLQPLAARVAGERRIERRVVRDDDHAVGGDRGIHLQRGDADRQRLLERRDRVLGRVSRACRGGPAGRTRDRPRPLAARASSPAPISETRIAKLRRNAGIGSRNSRRCRPSGRGMPIAGKGRLVIARQSPWPCSSCDPASARRSTPSPGMPATWPARRPTTRN